MTPALVLWLYALVVALYLPPLLSRLTACAASARLGLAVWLAATVSVLASSVTATWFLTRPAVVGWPSTVQAVHGIQTGTCVESAYRIIAFEAYLAIVAVAAVLAVLLVAWRYVRALLRARMDTRAHAEIARMVGLRRPTVDAVVLDVDEPVAYCVPGRRPAIVVSRATLAILDAPQVAAVLAHERAHLTGRHHLLTVSTRGLAGQLPGVPLFTRGAREVARLIEMCADDAAARRADRRHLVDALLAMATAPRVPAAALAANTTGITARVQRLLEPPSQAGRVRSGLLLSAVIVGLGMTLASVIAFAGSLTVCGF